MSYVLKVVDGPSLEGKMFPLSKMVLSCGRASPPCDIGLPSPKVSKHHCDFLFKEGRLYLRDKSSANGIFLNGVKMGEETQLKARDRLAIGEFVLEVMVTGV